MIGFIFQLRIPKSAANKLFPFSRFESNGRMNELMGIKAFKIFLNYADTMPYAKEMKLRTRQRDIKMIQARQEKS
jgi:hypothetical protein